MKFQVLQLCNLKYALANLANVTVTDLVKK